MLTLDEETDVEGGTSRPESAPTTRECDRQLAVEHWSEQTTWSSPAAYPVQRAEDFVSEESI